MTFFYNLSIRFYTLLVRIAAPFNEKARLWIRGRKNLLTLMSQNIDNSKPIAWFHSSSLGEFEQGRPVIEAFRAKYPNYRILLTFFSPSGYEVRKNYAGVDYVYYLPADTRRNALRFMQIVKPKVAFFVKYDFWYNYLNQLHQQNVPTYVFSSIFRPQQAFFKWYGGWYRKLLKFFTILFVQDENSKQLLANIGIRNVQIGGDTRFDRVYDLVQQAKPQPLIEQFVSGADKVLVAGSTWIGDEELLCRYANEHNIKMIIAPHETTDANVSRVESWCDGRVVKYTDAQIDETKIKDANVLIINCIGLLSSLYRYGQVAYIGGGFGKGIHNTLEAATYSVPVVFGPKYQKFREACQLIERKAAVSISDYEQLTSALDTYFNNAEKCQMAGKIASAYVDEMRGGTQLIMREIDGKL